MHIISKWKIIVSFLSIIISIIAVTPNFINKNTSWIPVEPINLGLDLKGGSHLLLSIDFDGYLDNLMQNLSDEVKKNLRQNKIGYKNFKVSRNAIEFQLRNIDLHDQANKTLSKIDNSLKITNVDGHIKCSYSNFKIKDLLNNVIEQSIEIIRIRVDSAGTKEPIIQRQGEYNILLQVPGAEDPEQLKNIVGQTAKLTFHLVDEVATAQGSVISPDSMLIATNDKQDSDHIVVKKKVIVSGDHLTNAKVAFNQYSQPIVGFSFNQLGSKLFGEATKLNTGKRLAIVLDKKLLSAPVINEPILGGDGTISGNFTINSASELALLLRAGALPTSLQVIEERTIGAGLGADAIADGAKAAIIGFIAVVIFMIWAYGIFGVFANIALVIALLYILASLSLLQATLTLPGIAGIILTIGMAVDANVLIYERIKEELRIHSSYLYAIKLGFDSAFSTITDANITTLMAAILLYIFGVGPIKGFAVTLTIGVISSMFSAIVITKLLIDLWVKFYKPKKLSLL
ncbi:MAG: protein translocase subunit SecD [Rickettsiaceae bacterium]